MWEPEALYDEEKGAKISVICFSRRKEHFYENEKRISF